MFTLMDPRLPDSPANPLPNGLSDVCRRADSQLAGLLDGHQEIAAEFDVAAIAERVRVLWQKRGYKDAPEEMTVIWHNVREQFGIFAEGRLNQLLLYKLIATSETRISNAGLPQSVVREYIAAFSRILDKPRDAESFHHSSDSFLKDLGICTQLIVPAGYYVLETVMRINWHLLFAGGVAQFVRLSWLYLIRYRARGPFFLTHLHDDHKDTFTPEGRVRTFRIVAELMRSRSEYKAVVSTAWYYDPAMRQVSPHLTYLRALPEEHGGYFFQGRPKIHRGVFTSRTRTQLYREGRYVPRPYTLVWPRQSLVRWASGLRMA